MAKSPKTFTSHSPRRARTLSGPATRRRSTRELLQTRNRAFGPNGVPTTSRQTSATRTDTTSRLPISLGSTNKRYEPSTHLRPAAKESKEYVITTPDARRDPTLRSSTVTIVASPPRSDLSVLLCFNLRKSANKFHNPLLTSPAPSGSKSPTCSRRHPRKTRRNIPAYNRGNTPAPRRRAPPPPLRSFPAG